ncbi:MAG: YggT family protein [Alphaproteobacteria bacterium]|nr:YggT family protein [Alphaproteobacteria bacterium]
MVIVVVYLLRFLTMLIIVDALLSWVMPDPRRFPRNYTTALTEPMYAPIHAILSPQATGGLDFSPIVLIFLFRWLEGLLMGMVV